VSAPRPAPGVSVPCLYDVDIRHRRRSPVHNAFRHRSYMWLFDLDCPPRLVGPLGVLARYRSADHLDVRAQLRHAGVDAARILVLTNLRTLGYVFNPITIYWCYDEGDRLVAQVAEVHNTYGDRHAYVLPNRAGSADGRSVSAVRKAMYVSPFYPVEGVYRIRVGEPGETLSVSVVLDRDGDKPFLATLSGRRREPTVAGVLRCAFRHPVAPLRGRVLIQLEGLRLWRKRLEVQPR